MPFGVCAAWIFCEQSALFQCGYRFFAMVLRIYSVQPVSGNRKGGYAGFECRPVGGDVNAVSQTADDGHIGNFGCQVQHQTTCHLFAALRTAACADHAHHFALVGMDISFAVEQNRRIRTIAQAHGIGLITKAEHVYIMPADEGLFGLGFLPRL